MKIIKYWEPPIYGLLDDNDGECQIGGLYRSRDLHKWITNIIDNKGNAEYPCYQFHETHEIVIEYKSYKELEGYMFKYPELFI